MVLERGKYTIAWFKLAEFVSRKEKERALAIYKLLAHSLSDEALASQLEGDILFSFSDEKGIHAHVKAAALYEKNHKFEQAAALYENLSFIVPDFFEYSFKAMQLYARVNNTKKFTKAVGTIAALVSKQKLYDQIDALTSSLPLQSQILEYFDTMAIALVSDKTAQEVVKQILQKALDLHRIHKSLPDLLLNKLSQIDEQLFEFAHSLVTQD